MDLNSEKLLKSALICKHSWGGLSFAPLLGADPMFYFLKSLVGDQVHRLLHPQLGHPVEQYHSLLAVPTLQAAGYGNGGLPLGIFAMDGGPIVEQELHTVRAAHG